MPWHRRRPVRLLAIAVALFSLAAAPAVQGLLARDGKAQAQLQPGQYAPLAAAWASALPLGPTPCEDGMAGPFPCDGIDLASLVTIPELGVGLGSDVWGWHDTETGREIALPTTTAGLAFVDVTDPAAPVVLGRMTIGQDDPFVLWRDVKVYEDHAFVVSEHAGTSMIVFDLTRLRDVTSDEGLLEPDVVYDEFASAHNIAINTDTGFAYAVGSDTCEAGLHMVDVREPTNPTFAGCFGEDGYTHDVECVVYDGPDTRYTGHEICFASNEDTLTIVDVTDKDAPVMLSRNEYDSAAYTHQGSITPDHRFFLFGDELDEQGGTVESTTTYVTEVADLENPSPIQAWTNGNSAIDHNLYVEDDLVWAANYASGLRVHDYTTDSLRAGELEEIAFFDVFPPGDPTEFAGAWTAYPYFPSGTIVANSFDTGLFVLTSDLSQPDPATEPAPEPEEVRDPAPEDPGDGETGAEPATSDDDGSAQPASDVAPSGAPLPATGGGAAALALLAMGAATRLRDRRRAGLGGS